MSISRTGGTRQPRSTDGKKSKVLLKSRGKQADPLAQLTEAEKGEMFAALLRCPDLHERMLTALTPEDVATEDEKYQVLVMACRRLREQATSPAAKAYKTRLTTTIKGIVDDYEVDDPRGVAGDELLEEGGIVRTAFATDPTEYDRTSVLGLLKRYLLQRRVAEPLAQHLDTALSEGVLPADLAGDLDKQKRLLREIDQLTAKPVRTVGDKWKAHKRRVKATRGKTMIGLATGMEELDRRTLGLRGLTIVAAKPGVGKTTLTIQLTAGVCKHHDVNDAVVVILNLDMSTHDLMGRLHSHLSGVEWAELMFGSKPSERQEGKMFSSSTAAKLAEAEQRLEDEQIGRRLVILDRTDLGENVTAERIVSLVAEAKKKAGAKRALVVVDYLQLIPVLEEGTASDATADKARVRAVQQVIEQSRTDENPQGDAVVVISEARKPPNAKEKWGGGLAELMGSARLAYAADAVILYHEMSDRQLAERYGVKESDSGSKRKWLLDRGIVPLLIVLEKGRDGMRRGSWPVEFHFRTSTFVEGSATAVAPPDDEDDDEEVGDDDE